MAKTDRTVFLEQVKKIVDEQMGDPNLNVEKLAKQIGISGRQLQRRLQAAAGISVAALIRNKRLEYAAHLLRERRGSVSEVARRAGFKRLDHFSRLFHLAYGVPPSRYRSSQE